MAQQIPQLGIVLALPWVELSGGAGNCPDLEDLSETDLFERLETGERIAASERITAPILFAELLSSPSLSRLTLVRNSRKYASYLLSEMLLEKSRESWFDDPRRALETTRLALAIAEQLDESFYGHSLVRGLQARAWAYLANGYRIDSDHGAAEKAFRRSDELLVQAPIDSLERAEILSLKVSLRRALRQFEAAGKLLDEIIAIYRRSGDDHQLAKALIQKGTVLGDLDPSDEAVKLLREGLCRVDQWREPRMVGCALQNLALCLNELGRPDEALLELEKSQEIVRSLGDRLNLVRVRWIEGRILASRQQYEEAEEAFLEVRKSFDDRGIGFDSALVSIDLALLYARHDQPEKIRSVAEKLLPVFQSQNVSREAMAALILFQHAAEKQIATLGLIQELASYLRRTQILGVNSSDDFA